MVVVCLNNAITDLAVRIEVLVLRKIDAASYTALEGKVVLSVMNRSLNS